MIAYIKGIVDSVEEDKIILDKDGIGFNIFMPQSDLQQLGCGEEVKIYTYHCVRDDAMRLYGFLDKESFRMYQLLLGVNGVGPKGGLSIIAACPGNSLHLAILSGDVKSIAKAQGIGGKTAQKIIIELKDRIDFQPFKQPSGNILPVESVSGIRSDAVEALTSLGYSKNIAYNAVKAVYSDTDTDVEILLKKALKFLS